MGKKTMNEDFFSKFHQSPRPEFARSLYEKLMQDTKTSPVYKRYFTVKRMAFGLMALCLVFILSMTMSPATRAAARAVIDSIIGRITVKGITVSVSEDPPMPSGEGESESYSEIWTPIHPDDISANHSFFAKLPTWIPAGYTIQERAALYYGSMYGVPPSSALFQWKNKMDENIQLWILRGACPNGSTENLTSNCTLATYITVGMESEPQIVAINDQPAILYEGIMGLADLSGSVRTWNPSRWKPMKDVAKGMSMIWEDGERTFWLTIESTGITKEEMLRLAESIP
jgi:hypothetical protein